MGNDGGSIPTRRELVKEAARNPNISELKATQHEASTHAWTYCPLSHRPLAAPIVSDSSGTLYNKDAVLEFLLPNDDDVPASVIREKEEILQGRVKGLKDVVEVRFNIAKEGKEEKRICPISSKELGAGTKSVYLVPCGHAFSEAAIREIKSEACIECNEAYTAENIIPILPISKDDIEKLAARATKLKEGGLTHSLKKAPGEKKKKRKHAAEADGSASTAPKSQPKADGGIKNPSTATLTAKVLSEQEQLNKRRKIGMNDNLKSLFSSEGYNAQKQKGGDFMTRGFSLPKKS